MASKNTTLPPHLSSSRNGDILILVVTRGDQIGARYELGDRVILGRDPSCTIRISELGVSRRHAEILSVEGGGHILRDLDSMNGVRVNGDPVRTATLLPGDRIELGQAVELHYLQRDQHERIRDRDARLKSLGKLASSVAHDLNNLLSVLTYGLPVIEDASSSPEVRAESIADMRAAVAQGVGLVDALLLFAADKPAPHEPVNLSELVHEAARLVGHRGKQGVRIALHVMPDIVVRGNAGRLCQIPHNLAVNALDAMPNGGRLDITLCVVDVHPETTLSGRLKPGKWAYLAVTDNGSGMTRQTADRIFEPYFTTRPEGSGIGLATVFGVVREHHGDISVDSAVGQGTTFSVYLPLLGGVPEEDDVEDTTEPISINTLRALADHDSTPETPPKR